MRSGSTTPGAWIRLGAALTTLGAVGVVAGTGLAGAATTWTRSPGAGFAGAPVHVASSAASLCRWVPPPSSSGASSTDPGTDVPTGPAATGAPSSSTSSTTGGARGVDGTRVELRLSRPGVELAVGTVAVTAGGAWAGEFTVPPVDRAPAAGYQLTPRCIVDDPSVPGAQSFDFDPQPFGVVEGPPPTTVTAPPTIPPPVTVDNPTEVQGARVTRDRTTSAAAAAPTLPNTGGGTLGITLAGLAAIGLGGGALWWGARAARRARTVEAG